MPSPDLRLARSLRITVLALAMLASPALLLAQAAALHDVLPNWIGLLAAPGRERAALDAVSRASTGWSRGPLASLVRRTGRGSPRRLIACSIDRPAYAVSEIASDGYLRVHNAEPGRQHSLWDQFHEGQRVLVQTRGGVVPGVFAVRSTHLWRRRAQQEPVATADDLWLDVGAGSAAEVASLGIRMIDPVVREMPTWSYGDSTNARIAGPAAAARAGCAAVAAIATGVPAEGENIYLLGTHGSYSHAAISAAVSRYGPVDEIILAGVQPVPDSGAVTVAAPRVPIAGARSVPAATIGVRVRFGGTLVESVTASDVDALAEALAAAAIVPRSAIRPVRLPAPPAAPPTTARRDELSLVADLLGRLSDEYGVSRHEENVREAVLAELPEALRARTTVDSAGNLVLALGPERDTVVAVAHLDEIGFEVTRIARDGTLSLATRGGFFSSLWEGQPALLHVGARAATVRTAGLCGSATSGPLRGVFVMRDSAARRQPPSLTAWFGVDSAALVAQGVGVGSAVTGYKCATRLAGTRFGARSIDDRAGSAALVLAARAIDPGALLRKVIFVWSVREEIGLEGAAAIAATYGPSVRRVHAVDTFVSSDSPLESSRFARAPIGAGAVVRALDNSSVTVPEEVDRVLALARSRRIPVQVGTTNGGNDGSELVRFGALNVPLAWPLRYSHSPAEVVDLRDIRALADVVRAVVEAP